MSRRYSKDDNERGSVPDWLRKAEEKKKDMDKNPEDYVQTEHGKVHKDKILPKEEVVQHTPSRSQKKEPKWAYTLKEGGQKHFVDLPKTEEQIAKVKEQLTNPHNWRRYHKNPYGGDVNYTQINCFPPFDYIRAAEVYLPTGEVWRSRTRKFHKNED